MFSPVDFVLFGLFLLLSLLVGLYQYLATFFRGTTAFTSLDNAPKTSDFLDGGRRLPVLPVCLSLLTTFVSGIGLLSVPAEIYIRGTAMALFNLFGSLAFPLIGLFFIPIFFKLKFLNAYEYFEHRFQSRALRQLATVSFIVNTLVYMAVVVYAPAIALSGVTGLPLWPFVLLVGVVSTVYTAAGGIRAVIWTDTLQAGFIYAGLAIIVVRGTVQAGGLSHVLAVNERTGRLWSAFRTHPSIFQYNNVWIECVGGLLQWTCIYGLNQMAMQRYCSMPSLRHAHIVLALTVPANLIIQLMIAYIGILMAAYFDGCNPLAFGEVKTVDQMTILMASRIFDGVPGLPGMFLATIFSATLSTASSGINSLTAVLWEDFLKVPLHGMSETRKSASMKTISVFFGVLSTCMAFACANLGGIFSVMLPILGAISGPLVGLFFLGIFFPSANKFGAFVAFTLSFAALLFCTSMNIVQQPYRHFAVVEGATTTSSGSGEYGGGVGCVEYGEAEALAKANTSAAYINSHALDALHFGRSDASIFAKLSPFCYATLGVVLVLLLGVPASWMLRQKMSAAEQRLAFACTYRGLAVPLEKQKRGETVCEQKHAMLDGKIGVDEALLPN